MLTQALEVASKAMDRAQDLESQLAGERERSARAERMAEELRHTLASYRRALTEQSESLAEERARTLAAEAAKLTDQSRTEAISTPLSDAGQRSSWGRRIRHWLWGEKAG